MDKPGITFWRFNRAQIMGSVGVLISFMVLTTGNQAQPLTGTLKKIKDARVITIGVRDASVPFSYLTDKGSYQGYSIDLCSKAILRVRKELGLASLKTVMTPVTSATRIPLIANGTIDLECGSTTNNLERQRQVAFSYTTFVTSNRLLSRKSSGIQRLADLKGKKLVSTVGTANLKQVTSLNQEKNLGIKILSARDNMEAFQMVEGGLAAAFAMDDVLLASLIANSRAPGDFVISTEAMSVEPYGIMIRREDAPFKKVIDAALAELYASGEIQRIYQKWFLSPIPPKGANLNFPMTPQLKRIFAKPTDSGDPANYDR